MKNAKMSHTSIEPSCFALEWFGNPLLIKQRS